MGVVSASDTSLWSENGGVTSGKAKSAPINIARWYILDPSCIFLKAWDSWMSLLIVYTAVVIPYHVFFQPSTVSDVKQVDDFENLLYASFVLDVVLNFLRGYADPMDGHLVTDPRSIASRYARGWLLIDLVSILPLEYVALPSSAAGSEVVLSCLVRLTRMARFVKVLNLSKLVQWAFARWTGGGGGTLHPAFARMAAVFLGTLLTFHWLACIWWFIGASNATGETVWLDLYSDGLRGRDPVTQYISSFWFIVSTMAQLGIGDIAPRNNRERVFSMFIVLIGLMWGALLISDLSTLVQEIDASHTGTVAKRRKLELFAKHARLPAALRHRMLAGFDRTHARESALVLRAQGYDPREVLGYVPDDVRREIILFTRRRLRNAIPLLASLPDAAAAWILERLHRRSAMKGELLAVEGAPATEMFFLTTGRVELTHSGTVIATYGPGSFFGDMDCLFSPERVAGVDCLGPCEYYVLSSADLHDAVHRFADLATRLRRTAAVRLRRYGEVVGEPLVGEDFLHVLEADAP